MLQLESLETRAVFSGSPLLAGCGGTDEAALQRDPHDVHVVFAPNTPAEVVAAYEDLEHQEGFDEFNFSDSSRWSRTANNPSGLRQGDPTIITWSIAPDGTPISGYNGEPSGPSNLRAFLNGIYGSNPNSNRAQDQPWFSVFQQTVDRWSEVSGVTYVFEPNDDGAAISSSYGGVIGVRGDVRISGHRIDGNSNILAYNFYPTVGDMVIDTADSFYTNTANNSLRLRNTLAHELGHGLGLGHVTPTNGTKLMEPSITLGFDGPQADDILAIQRGYGDRFEKNGGNDTAATASSLGNTGTFSIDTVSIDDDSDIDWYQFTVGASAALNVTLTPTGSTYSSNGATFNSLAQSDLALAVYGNNGSTLIASANINGIGVGEAFNNLALPGSGTYYVRITGAANAAQMYRLSGSVTNTAPAPDIAVLDGATNIADNSGAVSFGNVFVGDTATKTFTVRNTGNANLVLDGNITLPSGFSLTQGLSTTTLAPGAATTFVVALNTTTAGTYSGMVSLNSNDADENPFNFNVSGAVATVAPEIAVLDGTTDIADNSGAVSLGTVQVGANASKVFTVRNTGAANLTLGAITLPNGFTLSQPLGSTTLAPGASTTFAVTLNTTAVGSFSGTLSLVNNDADENPFNFTLSGSVATTQTLAADDFNRPNSYSLGSPWQSMGGSLGLASGQVVNYGTSTSTAIVSGSSASDVVVTAKVDLGATGDYGRNTGVVARYGSGGSLYWGGITYNGGNRVAEIWRYTGGWTRLAVSNINVSAGDLRFEVVGSSLKLYLNDALVGSSADTMLKSGAVGVLATHRGGTIDDFAAQAPSTTPAPAPTPTAPEIAILDGTNEIADNTGAINFGSVTVGDSATKTFTVRNTGDGALSLGALTLPNGFSLVQGLTTTTLAPGAATTFVVALNTNTAGNFSGMLSLANNDANESPYNFTLSGTVAALPAPEITLLDGANEIASGTGAVNFGSVNVGSNATKTFTVRNDGTASLTLSAPQLPAGFTLAQGLGATTLAPGASTTFVVALNTSTVGSFSGTLTLANNDANESSYRIALSGTVADTSAALASDSFDRPNSSNLGGEWRQPAGQQAIVNGALQSSAWGTSVAVVAGTTSTDVVVAAHVDLGVSGDGMRNTGVVARYSGSGVGSLYWGGITANGSQRVAEIWRSVNGGWLRLAASNISANSGDLRFEVIGSSLKLYLNDALVGSATDTYLKSGLVGALQTNRGGQLDDFVATPAVANVTAPASATNAYPAHWVAALDYLMTSIGRDHNTRKL